jgi:hypothetical protein
VKRSGLGAAALLLLASAAPGCGSTPMEVCTPVTATLVFTSAEQREAALDDYQGTRDAECARTFLSPETTTCEIELDGSETCTTYEYEVWECTYCQEAEG